jgi:RimJ/RimL family protein N-acetyltransferase
LNALFQRGTCEELLLEQKEEKLIDAAKYEVTDTLKKGAVVKIRSIKPEDKEKLSEAFRNLESESIYTRFFQHRKDLTEKELKAATEVDFENMVALVVTVGEGENEIIIGGGRYVIMDNTAARRSAEVAFTVEEDYHGQGIAGRLLQHLARIGREKGVSNFVAEVLPGNKAMLAVFSRAGFPMQKHHEEGVMHVKLSLKEASSE